jgi:hypothetical protein
LRGLLAKQRTVRHRIPEESAIVFDNARKEVNQTISDQRKSKRISSQTQQQQQQHHEAVHGEKQTEGEEQQQQEQ